jgi:hypothetical protein
MQVSFGGIDFLYLHGRITFEQPPEGLFVIFHEARGEEVYRRLGCHDVRHPIHYFIEPPNNLGGERVSPLPEPPKGPVLDLGELCVFGLFGHATFSRCVGFAFSSIRSSATIGHRSLAPILTIGRSPLAAAAYDEARLKPKYFAPASGTDNVFGGAVCVRFFMLDDPMVSIVRTVALSFAKC